MLRQRLQRESSVLVAQQNGKAIGLIETQEDAPGVDNRFFGAATALRGGELRYNTFLALIGSDISVPEADTRKEGEGTD